MVLNIRLLGRPAADLDGRRVPGPRGRKAWALLAVLLLAERAPSRHSLAELLFPGGPSASCGAALAAGSSPTAIRSRCASTRHAKSTWWS
jgi:DNA-binding SARP family transcriptional activator